MIWTVETLDQLFKEIRNKIGLEVDYNIVVDDKGKYPLSATKVPGELKFIPDFFNHQLLPESHKKMLAIFVYSGLYLRKGKEFCHTSPEALAKGVCDAIGAEYISMHRITKCLIPIRRQHFCEPEYACMFSIGEEWRVGIGVKYRVARIDRQGDKTKITVDVIRSYASDDPSSREYFEEDLCEDYPHNIEYYNTPMDLRRNIYILSAPSGCGKNTVFAELQKRMPHIRRALTATTRSPRDGEKSGVDYIFCFEEEFDKLRKSGGLIEEIRYDNACYGIPISEIEKHSVDTPVFLIVDTIGKKHIVNERYPLGTSIFLMPPSLDELANRLRSRGANSETEIANRLNAGQREIVESRSYDYVIVNDDIEECVDEICKVIAHF